MKRGVDIVLNLAVPEAALIDRLAGRSGRSTARTTAATPCSNG
jgi:hypothetical protein